MVYQYPSKDDIKNFNSNCVIEPDMIDSKVYTMNIQMLTHINSQTLV